VVEENTRAAEHVIRLAVLLDNPITIELRYSVWGVWVERCILVLWYLLYLTIELRGRCLIDAAGMGESAGANCLQHAQNACGIDVGGELGRVEADLYVALSSQVIDLIRTHLADDLYETHGVREVAVVEVEMGFAFEMRNALTIIYAATTDDTMHLVAFVE
jgi:hypothetical protein